MESFDWIKALYAAGEEPACPDVIKYTTVIGALNKGGHVDQAFILLGELIDSYCESKLERYKPDSRCFHIVLSAFSRSKGNRSAGGKAEQLLRQMWRLCDSDPGSDLRPTQWTYNTVIFCYQNVGDPNSAEKMLFEMGNMAHQRKIDRGPDLRAYRAVVHAWRVSNDRDKFARIHRLQGYARARFNQQI